MTSARFTIGDTVWSKMKGYCPWPSRIAEPSESTLKPPNQSKGTKPSHLVYFFGSNNYAWLSEDNIKPYIDFKDKNKNGSKSSHFKEGLKQIEEFMKKAVDKPAEADNAETNDSSNNEGANNFDSKCFGDTLPSVDEELALINNEKTQSSPNVKIPANSKGKGKRNKAEDPAFETPNSPSKKAKVEEDSSTFPVSAPKSPPAVSRNSNSKSGARNVLLRASQFNDEPTLPTPQINMGSATAKSKTIKASTLKFGFVGLGLMGQRLLKNLLNSGHKVTIWNRTPTKCEEFVEFGATRADTPADVVIEADITFSCLADPKASKEIVFGPFGILAEMNSTKCFVEMSSIDPETSNDISEAILSKGGRYLEAPMIGNGKEAAEEGELTIVAAGDKTLYSDCSSCFEAMAKQTFFLGHQVGSATKMNLILSMLYGTLVGSLVECCTLIERTGLNIADMKEILKLSPMSCPLLNSKMDRIIANDYSIHMPLNHLQKDLRLALALSEEYDQTIPITAATNEVYKMAKRYGYGDHDAAAVYLKSRF